MATSRVVATPPDESSERLASALQASIGGAYTVESEIGAGGMARVFVATDSRSGRRVAIKVLSPAVASCCDAERFRQEMTVVASLRHPNIVPLIGECDVCGGGRLFYFVMPYVEGESLRARLQRERALPVPDAVRILRDVALALAHAHAAGVVHRDIKPENVLLADSRALVTDFGIAKAVSRSTLGATGRGGAGGASHVAARGVGLAAGLTRAGYIVGTPAYAAPEQSVGDPTTDHRADLYALGALAYEMLTGAAPFGDRSPLALVAAHLAELPAPLRASASLPAALATLVMRLLEKDPQDRPATAESVLHDLAELHL